MSSRLRPGREAVADDRRDDAAEIEAAFGADVEDAGPERDRRGEPGQQERRGLRQRGRDAPFAAEGFLDHQPVDRDRLVAGHGENDGADADRERKGRHGSARPRQATGRPSRRSCRPLAEHHAPERADARLARGRSRRRSAP